MKFVSRLFIGLLSLFLVTSPFFLAGAQTANTAVVLGTITDMKAATVPNALVELTNTATNETKSIQTNDVGQYVFLGVVPGNYKLKITKEGFAVVNFGNVVVNVAKSYTFDATLEIRSKAEVIEVTASTTAELQTTDAVIGNVVGGQTLMHLPTLQRDTRELLTLQAGSTPYETTNGGGFGDSGGTVAGARSDQNAFNLDGIDITDNVIAGGGNQVPIVPIGVESTDEFRVGITNNNASFGRASGGQINVISKSGSNQFHGAAYWLHQNSVLNANKWDLNHTPDGNGNPFTEKPSEHDNRGGFSFGGPFWKDKTFFFGNYEIRRFPQSAEIIRIVPSESLRQGILTFNGVPYNLASSTACGPSGNLPCDPRGIGISPTIQQLWNMMPAGNDPNLGDGINTIGFRASVAEPLKDDTVSFRLDHTFNQKLKFFGRYIYHRDLAPNASGEFTGQVDLRGGTPVTPSASNLRGDGFISGLTYAPNSHISHDFRVGWIRSRQDFVVTRPRTSAEQLALPGTDSALGPVALAPGLAQTGLIDTVIDVDTQRARHQAIYDSNKQYVYNLSWIKGRHTIVTGLDFRWLPTIHDRDDKVIGSLNSLVAALDADVGPGLLSIADANRPPSLSTGDAQRWDRLYAAALGLIDNVGVLAVRDGNLQPKPLGATLIARTTLRSHNFFAQDTWRLTPSFTLTYGLAYGWQTTPHEADRQQTLIANHDASDTILNAFDYIDAKRKAAENGDFYNPTLSYVPINDSGRSDVFNPDYGNIAPRVSGAWNPGLHNGVLGRLFGDRKTVLRAGYGIAYDRVNTVQSVIIPMLGVGFAQTINLVQPSCTASGTAGAKCNVSSTAAGSVFRVGVDGQVPTPPPPAALTSPVVPNQGYSELLSFQNDPDFKVGRSHMIDFTIQRSIPGGVILELGYVGRFGRHLPASVNFNSVPYMFKDKVSGQTFAQAFDAVATQIRNGTDAAAVSAQSWFENLMPGFGSQCQPALTATACFASQNSSAFANDNLSSLFLNMDVYRAFNLGLPAFDNTQVVDLFTRTSRDKSNYNALVVDLRNNVWHGLLFDLNYTFSKSLDTVGAVQNDARYYSSSFDPHLDYGPSFFNRPHVFNAIFNYELPFGSGVLKSNHSFVNKLIGGWYTSGIFRASSGVPELVTISGQSFGGGLIFGTLAGEIATVPVSSLGGGSVHSGVCSSDAGSSGNGPNCSTPGTDTGTGLNYFKDPASAITKFRPALIATDTNDGRNNPLQGLGFWNLDLGFGKTTAITEQVKAEFSFNCFNVFNHTNFLDPSFDVTNPSTFGVINTQLIPADRLSGSRWIQFGLRISF
jgi:carboxypeptidase family protein